MHLHGPAYNQFLKTAFSQAKLQWEADPDKIRLGDHALLFGGDTDHHKEDRVPDTHTATGPKGERLEIHAKWKGYASSAAIPKDGTSSKAYHVKVLPPKYEASPSHAADWDNDYSPILDEDYGSLDEAIQGAEHAVGANIKRASDDLEFRNWEVWDLEHEKGGRKLSPKSFNQKIKATFEAKQHEGHGTVVQRVKATSIKPGDHMVTSNGREVVAHVNRTGGKMHIATVGDNDKVLRHHLVGTSGAVRRVHANDEPVKGDKIGFGEPYGGKHGYVKPDGTKLTMYRKGQKVRFFDDEGKQHGPEQDNVAPGVAYAMDQGWKSPGAWDMHPSEPSKMKPLSAQYVKSGKPTSDDVETLKGNYQTMHGKPAAAKDVAKLEAKTSMDGSWAENMKANGIKMPESSADRSKRLMATARKMQAERKAAKRADSTPKIDHAKHAGKYTAQDKRDLLKQGKAMKNAAGKPSYPIADEEDLHHAIHAVGRGGASHNAVRRHIIKNAKSLGLEKAIPSNWGEKGGLRSDDDLDTRNWMVWDLEHGGGGGGRHYSPKTFDEKLKGNFDKERIATKDTELDAIKTGTRVLAHNPTIGGLTEHVVTGHVVTEDHKPMVRLQDIKTGVTHDVGVSDNAVLPTIVQGGTPISDVPISRVQPGDKVLIPGNNGIHQIEKVKIRKGNVRIRAKVTIHATPLAGGKATDFSGNLPSVKRIG